MTTSTLPPLKLTPFHSKPHTSFFTTLSHHIITHHRLSNDAISAHASYATGRDFLNGAQDDAVFLMKAAMQMKAFVEMDENSLRIGDAKDVTESTQETPESAPEVPHLTHYQNLAKGLIYLAHTHAAYTATNKTQLLHTHSTKYFLKAVLNGTWLQDPAASLASFLMHAWVDVKAQRCVYWYAFVGVKLREAIRGRCVEVKQQASRHLEGSQEETETLLDTPEDPWYATQDFYAKYLTFRQSTPPHQRSFFLIRDNTHIHPLTDWENAFKSASSESSITLAFNDPGFAPQKPSWLLRNFLTASCITFKKDTFNVLCIRETPGLNSLAGSLLLECQIPNTDFTHFTAAIDESQTTEGSTTPIETVQFVGWEKNTKQKYGPRITNFASESSMELAESAATLNVQLMKWRMLPELQDKILSETKCLLLGAGTLGSYVARGLLGWGIFNITLVDRGNVSYSNPVRQPLYEFDDCQNGGKPKAEAAAAALRRIYPKVNARGVSLNIAMPGHVYDASEKDKVEQEVRALEELIREHDVVFMLTDTRESRWLPTLLGLVHDKVVINSALGFDSYVVMRHGALDREHPSAPRLGCYFCSDVVAPVNSMRDRTLDQQCTVTRPGLAGIAGMMATELLINMLHHPKRHRAPCTSHMEERTEDHSCLGIVPHQIRGSLYGFDTVRMHGTNYSQCIACSEKVLHAYETDGMAFLHQAFLVPSSLEQLTGLDALHEEMEERMLQAEDVEHDDEDDFEVL